VTDKTEIIKKVFSLFSFPKELEVKHEIVDEDLNEFTFLDYVIIQNSSDGLWVATYLELTYDNQIGNDINDIELSTSKNFLKALEACAADYFQRGVHSFLENLYENMYLDEMEAAKKAEAEGIND
jgi:hypothetical protein